MTVHVTCTHEDCPMPDHEVPDEEAAKRIGADHWKHKGHAIKYE